MNRLLRRIFLCSFASCALSCRSTPAGRSGVDGGGGGDGGDAGMCTGSTCVVPRELSATVLSSTTPIQSAKVTVYAAGVGAPAATKLATGATDAAGQLTFTYTCPASPALLYVVARGGNPGLASSTDNDAIHLMAALGPCATATETVKLNELTTVAAAYALNGFIGTAADGLAVDVDNVHGSDPGLTNAFAVAARLADVSQATASPPLPSASACAGATPPTDCAAEQKVNALANALAACTSASAASSAACTELFGCATPGATYDGTMHACVVGAGLEAASDTLEAVVRVARAPGGVSIDGMYDVASQSTAFAPALAAAPTDWTLALSVSGGGLSKPYDIAVDADGHVWAASSNGTLNEFSADGTPLSGNGYHEGGVDFPRSLAIDATGHIWVADAGRNALLAFDLDGNPSSPSSPPFGYEGHGINSMYDVAIAPDGHIWFSSPSSTGSSIHQFDSNGNELSPEGGYTGGGLNEPYGIAVDANGHVWVANYQGSAVTAFDATGTPLSATGFPGGGVDHPREVAIGPNGHVWLASRTNNTVNELAGDGSALSGGGYTGGGVDIPRGIAIDAEGHVWTASQGNDSVNELSPDGAPLSPAVGYLGGAMTLPYAIAIDPSGNVWVADAQTDALTIFIGAAAPTRTPVIEAITEGFVP